MYMKIWREYEDGFIWRYEEDMKVDVYMNDDMKMDVYDIDI